MGATALLRSRWAALSTGKVARGFASVLAGSVLGQGLVILSSPLLTRLYDPSDFGLLGVFTGIVAILGVLSTCRLELAVPLPLEESDAAAVTWAALALAGSTAGASAIVLLLLGDPLGELFGTPRLGELWWLVGFAVVAVGMSQAMSSWLVRRQAYGWLGGRNGLQGLAQVSTQIGLGLGGAGTTGLLLGLPVGRLLGIGGVMSRRGLLRQGLPSGRAMWTNVKRYRRFPLVASWSALINTSGLQLPVLVVSATYGLASAGLLALAVRLVVAPTVLVGQAVSDVFAGEVGRLVREREPRLERAVRTTTGRLLAVGVLPALVVAVTGPGVFEIVFGAPWREAGVLAQFLVLGYLGQLGVAPVFQILDLVERQTWALAWDVARVVLVVGGLGVCVAFGGSLTAAVATLSVASLSSYAALFVVCLLAARAADHRLSEQARDLDADADVRADGEEQR